MPIDRRTFVLGSGAAAAGGAFASFSAWVAATPLQAMKGQPSFDFRIVGWDRSEDPASPAQASGGDSIGWIAIDRNWRGAWR